MNNQNALNLYQGIRNRLVTKGWRKGGVDFRNKYSQKCLLDTIDIVSSDLNISYSETTKAEDLLRAIVFNNPSYQSEFVYKPEDSYSVSLIEWNDHRNRKFKDMLNLLDIAISMMMSELHI